ncbi:MAG: response regulator transcription factor [Dehalococcoidia bacterium]|nr:response regulator transcription factor [Dehalococcoidia bacterium]
MSKIRILIVDDHKMMRDGIREILQRQPDFEIVGEASNGEEAIKFANDLLPDVVIMDVGMPGMSGLQATEKIKARHPTMPVLVLTIHSEDEYIMGLIAAGAAGYLLKTSYSKQLVQAIRAVAEGEFVFDTIAYHTLLKNVAVRKPSSLRIFEGQYLTPRETQVLQMAANSMSNKDIAEALDISVRTVKGHLVNIFGKLQVGSRTEAVLVAIRNNWIHI